MLGSRSFTANSWSQGLFLDIGANRECVWDSLHNGGGLQIVWNGLHHVGGVLRNIHLHRYRAVVISDAAAGIKLGVIEALAVDLDDATLL